MSDTASVNFGWVCPACTRRVPGRIDRCRCGHERGQERQPDHGVAADAPSSDISFTTRPTWARTVLEGTLVCVAVAACAYYFTTSGSSQAPSRASAVAVRADQPRDGRDLRHSRDPRHETRIQEHPLVDRTSANEPGVSRELADDRPEPSAAPLEDMIEHAMPAVVLIEATRTRGSGFLARSGLVVTNAHVIAGAPSVTVTLQDGERVTGTVLQSSEELDLALVSIARASDAPLPLGASSDLRLGQGIVALGWAQDLTQSTVTRGIVTGLRHDGKQHLVQTDAVPNHGDSGGPVLDRRGQVIGVTTFRAEVSGRTAGFAVAVDDLKTLIASADR